MRPQSITGAFMTNSICQIIAVIAD